MARIALFPGTFDPITLGHIDIIRRAMPLFDKIYVGIGSNASKKAMFTAEERKFFVEEVFEQEKKVEAVIYTDLTIHCCERLNANYILRGIRFVADFEYEKTIADTNKALNPNIETIILTCETKYNSVTSSIVRDLIIHNGNISFFLHDKITQYILNNKKNRLD